MNYIQFYWLMGKREKKGTKGEVTQYCTRSQALKKLQLKLTEFR